MRYHYANAEGKPACGAIRSKYHTSLPPVVTKIRAVDCMRCLTILSCNKPQDTTGVSLDHLRSQAELHNNDG